MPRPEIQTKGEFGEIVNYGKQPEVLGWKARDCPGGQIGVVADFCLDLVDHAQLLADFRVNPRPFFLDVPVFVDRGFKLTLSRDQLLAHRDHLRTLSR